MSKKDSYSPYGHDWRSKKVKKEKSRSQTPGNQKTLACQATARERFFAKRNRSYKDRQYAQWALYIKSGNSRILVG